MSQLARSKRHASFASEPQPRGSQIPSDTSQGSAAPIGSTGYLDRHSGNSEFRNSPRNKGVQPQLAGAGAGERTAEWYTYTAAGVSPGGSVLGCARLRRGAGSMQGFGGRLGTSSCALERVAASRCATHRSSCRWILRLPWKPPHAKKSRAHTPVPSGRDHSSPFLHPQPLPWHAGLLGTKSGLLKQLGAVGRDDELQDNQII